MRKQNTRKHGSYHNSSLNNDNISVLIDKSESGRTVHRFSALLRPSWTRRSNSQSHWKKCHDDSYTAHTMSTFARGAPTDRRCEGRVSLACHTSFPVGPGKSIQRLRHDVQHPRRARSALHGDYHIACHIVGAPHEGEEDGGWDEREKRKRGGWGREGPTRDGSGTERRRTKRMWTLTALQYTQGHGVYKPPQFYLHPSSARITLAAGIKPFIVLWSGGSCLQPYIPLIFASGSLFLPQRPRVKVPFFSSSTSPVLIDRKSVV